MAYDPSMISAARLQGVAQEHCNLYGKDAIPQGGAYAPYSISSAAFTCMKRG